MLNIWTNQLDQGFLLFQRRIDAMENENSAIVKLMQCPTKILILQKKLIIQLEDSKREKHKQRNATT